VYLVQYVDFLLRHGASKDATPWVDQLHKKLPDDLGVLALRVRWLHDQKRGDEIGPAVEALAERLLEKLPADAKNRVAQEAQLSQEVGNVYTAIQQHAAAERWYRRLRKLDVGRFAPLAGSLARQNRLAEAIAVCVEAAKADASIQPAIVLTGVLGVGRPTAVEFKLAEPLLAQTLAQHGNDANLLNGVASVRILQQRSDEAIALYRRVVSLKPHDVLALNNLATLLAEQPTAQQEALRTIDEAIDVAGRLPILLDTKGTILVYNGNAADAVPLLTEAATAANVDPRFLFHLSLACAGAGKLDEARDSLKKALAGNLMQQILTSTDHRLLEELKQKLGS
jgi:tetratricopeptide (TPR) repeat protein